MSAKIINSTAPDPTARLQYAEVSLYASFSNSETWSARPQWQHDLVIKNEAEWILIRDFREKESIAAIITVARERLGEEVFQRLVGQK